MTPSTIISLGELAEEENLLCAKSRASQLALTLLSFEAAYYNSRDSADKAATAAAAAAAAKLEASGELSSFEAALSLRGSSASFAAQLLTPEAEPRRSLSGKQHRVKQKSLTSVAAAT